MATAISILSKVRIIAFVGLLSALCVPVDAAELQEGIHGMQWGAVASDISNLKKVREVGSVAYYVAADTLYQVGDQTVPSVVYGFFRGRLFAAYIKLGSPLQFSNLERHFSGKYGPPKEDHRVSDELTVLRWKVADVNIKLKMKSPGRDIKMAIYYRPLAGELTEAQAEEPPPGLYSDAPEAVDGHTQPQPLVE
jgi:hypothetical protein